MTEGYRTFKSSEQRILAQQIAHDEGRVATTRDAGIAATVLSSDWLSQTIIGTVFFRDGYPFRVMREYMPGMYEARGASGEVVVPVSEILG